MKKSIWKYDLSIHAECEIEVPTGSEVLHFGIQNDSFRVWILVNPDANIKEKVRLVIRGTGWDFDASEMGEYKGTVQAGAFVWHLFQIK